MAKLDVKAFPERPLQDFFFDRPVLARDLDEVISFRCYFGVRLVSELVDFEPELVLLGFRAADLLHERALILKEVRHAYQFSLRVWFRFD